MDSPLIPMRSFFVYGSLLGTKGVRMIYWLHMEDIMKADIFFFVTTIIVVILGIISAIAIIFFIKILSRLNSLSKYVEEEVQHILLDISSFRGGLTSIIQKAESFLSFFSRKTPPSTSRTIKKRRTKKNNT